MRCVANGTQYVDRDAWYYVGTDEDNDWRKRCRVAWTELWMFSKTCLPQLPGGKAKANRNRNLVLNRLERWRGGERASLWSELREPCGRNAAAAKTSAQLEKQQQEVCMAYAQQGMPGKAIDRLTGSGLAPDTDETFNKLRARMTLHLSFHSEC